MLITRQVLTMVKTAVILAAGLGQRLGGITKNKPKGLISIDGRPLIELSAGKLLAAGIERIIIATGHLQERYTEWALRMPQVTCVYNEAYAATGSLCTLYALRHRIDDDFILLESDLLYDRTALKILLHHHMPNVVLATDFTNSGDEVFVETDEHGLLMGLSKDKNALGSICGEFTGLTKLSLDAYQAMCAAAQSALSASPCLDYEQALVEAAKTVSIAVFRADGLPWCEIDNPHHLQRAVTEIYPRIKASEANRLPVRRTILLNPGPATTTDSVKHAQVVPDICPRESDFGEVMQWIAAELTTFVADSSTHSTVLFAGSGTAAVESVLSSVVGRDDHLLIINNGAYGRRMCQIARAYGLHTLEFPGAVDQPLDLVALECVMQEQRRQLTHVALVHNETTSGLLNDVAMVGALCKAYNLQLIVDAMSSYAAIPIDMKQMNISYLAASANKNLQGMAGVSFVIANQEKLAQTQHIAPRNFYLNLYSQYRHFTDTGQMRFTPPVQTLYALKQAVLETKTEGIAARYQRYTISWETLVAGLAALGLSHLVAAEHHSKIITAVIEPHCPRYNFNDMHDYLYRHDFTLYPGKLEGLNTFRVANIGDITYRDIEDFLALLQHYLKEKNVAL